MSFLQALHKSPHADVTDLKVGWTFCVSVFLTREHAVPGAESSDLLRVAGSRPNVIGVPLHPPLSPGGGGRYRDGVTPRPVASAGRNGSGLRGRRWELQPHPCSSALRRCCAWSFTPLTLPSQSINVPSYASIHLLLLYKGLLGLWFAL